MNLDKWHEQRESAKAACAPQKQYPDARTAAEWGKLWYPEKQNANGRRQAAIREIGIYIDKGLMECVMDVAQDRNGSWQPREHYRFTEAKR